MNIHEQENQILIQHRREELLKRELWKSAIYVFLNQEKHNNLIIKAEYQCLTVPQLLEVFVNGFLSEDQQLLEWLGPKMNELRKNKDTITLEKTEEKKKILMEQFGITEEEKNKIYQLFAEDIEETGY